MLWVNRLPRDIPRRLEDLNSGASRARLTSLTLETPRWHGSTNPARLARLTAHKFLPSMTTCGSSMPSQRPNARSGPAASRRKVRAGQHVNSFGLGDTGRYRTNVWDYAGVNTFRSGRDEDLALHPTVKPVALVGDAIRDCSKRGDVILDMFGGSGSTLIAADQAGRRARLIEYDPRYCDVIVARWEKLTGKTAVPNS